MATIGEQLKQARTQRNVTLEQAAHVTRVRIHYLRALEEDDRDLLPSDVQGRGFLRLYADYLGLPVEPLLDQWMGKIPEIVPPSPAPIEEAPIIQEVVSEKPITDGLDEEPGDDFIEPEEVTPPPAPKKAKKKISPRPAGKVAESAVPMLAEEKFRQIGHQLRKQREAMSLSLEDVERMTHMRQHHLQALEDGRMDALPSLVQARGALGSYAEFLSLNPETILLQYADALQIRRAELAPSPERGFRKAPSTPSTAYPRTGIFRFLTPDLAIGGGLFLLVLIFFIWGVSQINLLGNNQPDATAAPIAEILLTASTATPGVGGITETSSAESPGQANQATPTIGPMNNDPLQIYIIARQRVWMQVIADGRTVFSGRTTPGTAYPFSGVERIEVTGANAAALQIYFNQQDLGTLGSVGQIVRLVFTPGQILTATPQFTATRAPTQVPTSTLQPTATPVTPTITPYIP